MPPGGGDLRSLHLSLPMNLQVDAIPEQGTECAATSRAYPALGSVVEIKGGGVSKAPE